MVHVTANYINPDLSSTSVAVTVPISYSDHFLAIQSTASGAIYPGYAFSVRVITQSVLAPHAQTAVSNVNVALYVWDGATLPTRTMGTSPLGTPIATCTSLAQCDFVLPALGKHLLVATHQLPAQSTLYAALPVGENAAFWQTHKLSSAPSVRVYLDKEAYHVGDEMHVTLYNPYSSSKVLTRLGNNAASSILAVHEGMQGHMDLALRVPGQCLGSCYLTVVLSAPPSGLEQPSVAVPTSVLYNAQYPQAHSVTLSVVVVEPPEALKITMSVVPSSSQKRSLTVKAVRVNDDIVKGTLYCGRLSAC